MTQRVDDDEATDMLGTHTCLVLPMHAWYSRKHVMQRVNEATCESHQTKKKNSGLPAGLSPSRLRGRVQYFVRGGVPNPGWCVGTSVLRPILRWGGFWGFWGHIGAINRGITIDKPHACLVLPMTMACLSRTVNTKSILLLRVCENSRLSPRPKHRFTNKWSSTYPPKTPKKKKKEATDVNE